MAKENDQNFGELAVQQGFCSREQLRDALSTLEQVRNLGLNENLGHILVKKKVMNEEQVKKILQIQAQQSKVKIANYEILEKVGQGGMGAVFKARQISLDRIVALKILSPKLAEDTTFAKRFIKEARSVAKLSHPNIIVGIDVGREGKYYYFAMEYVDGRTALEILRDKGPFGEAEALNVAMQVGLALDHAHKHSMVHRDIKPDNIMFSNRGEVKLCDLGLAKIMDTNAASTQTGQAVGTPHYIAPEQARGESNVAISADIYALGASLYHMVAGRTLYKGDTSAMIMTQHLADEAPNLRKLRKDISENFCRLLEKMMAKAPADRYQTPAEMMEDIQRIQQGQPLKGVLPPNVKSSMERTPRPGRMGRRTTGPQAPVRGTTGPRKPVERSTTGPRSPIDRPDAPTGPKKAVGPQKALIFAGAAVALGLVVGLALVMAQGDNPSTKKNLTSKDTTPDKPDERPDDPAKKVGASETQKKPAPQPQSDKKQDEPPKVVQPKLWMPPERQTDHEPLNLARQAYRDNPRDYNKIAGLYDTAAKSAPADLRIAAEEEKAKVLELQTAAFEDLLKNRRREAEFQSKVKNFGRALGLVDPKLYPEPLMRPELVEKVNALSAEIAEKAIKEYNAAVRPDLDKALKNAGNKPEALADLQKRVGELMEVYPPKETRDHLKSVQAQVNARLNAEKEAAKKKADEKFDDLMDRIMADVEGRKPEGLAPALDAARKDADLKAHHDGTVANIQKDLVQAVAQYGLLARALDGKVKGKQEIKLTVDGEEVQGKAESWIGSGKGADRGIAVKTKDGKTRNVQLVDIAAEDVLALTGVNPKSATGAYALANYALWSGQWNDAYTYLARIRKGPHAAQAAVYRKWLDGEARKLMNRIQHQFAKAHTPNINPKAKKKHQQNAQPMIERLKAKFATTEAYRARAAKK